MANIHTNHLLKLRRRIITLQVNIRFIFPMITIRRVTGVSLTTPAGSRICSHISLKCKISKAACKSISPSSHVSCHADNVFEVRRGILSPHLVLFISSEIGPVLSDSQSMRHAQNGMVAMVLCTP